MYRKGIYIAAFFFLCLLCLAGCGKTETADEKAASGEPEALESGWQANGFAVSGEIREEQGLWPAKYIRWEHGADGGFGLMRYKPDAFGECIYHLFEITGQGDSERRYRLEKYDTTAMLASETEIDGGRLGLDGGFIADMDVIEDGVYAFLIMKYDFDETNESRLVRADMVYTGAGEAAETVDLMPAIRKKGLEDIYQGFSCDSSGNIYLRELDGDVVSNRLFILGRDGDLQMESGFDSYDEVAMPVRMPEGELVFPVSSHANRMETYTRFVWFDLDEKEMRVLAVLEKEDVKQAYGLCGTALYYDSYDGIVKWDLASGDRTLVFSFDKNAVADFYSTMLIFRDGQEPVLRMYANVNAKEEDWLVPFDAQEPEKVGTVRIVSLIGDSGKVRDCASLAARWNPQFSFTYETSPEKEREDHRARIMAELTAGNGPDLLYVSLEDMRYLQEMGVLADLEGLLTEEERSRILPGIVEMGTVDGAFVGLAPEMELSSMVTLKSIWGQGAWNLDDVMGLMAAGDFTGLFCQGTMPFAPRALLLLLTEFGIQNAVLIDWETGESHFDSDQFIEMLELAKAYGVADPLEAETWLGIGGCPGMFVRPSLEEINSLYEQYGDEYFFVGNPSNGTGGNYLDCDGVLVVNKNTAGREAVSVYLGSILGDDIQYLDSSVSKESILRVSQEDVTTKEQEGERILFWRDIRLQVKENGTTTLDDYRDLLESCIPRPKKYDEIKAIVWEECQSYIAGEKSAQEAARIADNRIQLYLDERK